jgi:hypothetical protein
MRGNSSHRFKSKANLERKRINLIINQNQLRKDTLLLSLLKNDSLYNIKLRTKLITKKCCTKLSYCKISFKILIFNLIQSFQRTINF